MIGKKRKFIIIGDFMIRNKKIIIAVVFLIISTISVITAIVLTQKESTIETLSKYGSRGNEVTKIQTKLKRWGYYSGSVDRNIWN